MPTKIQITGGYYALVDENMYDFLSQWKWNLSTSGYAYRKVNNKNIYMHHEVLGGRIAGLDVDHKNKDRLDMRVENLRYATRQQNMINKDKQVRRKGTSSVYKGVGWHTEMKMWRARLGDTYLGCFPTEVEAARAYNVAALALHGDYARLNEV